MNFLKFFIWFSVLKSTHQAASFDIHKSVIIKKKKKVGTSNFFFTKVEFSIFKNINLNLFFSDSQAQYTTLFDPGLAYLTFFVFSHSLQFLYLFVLKTYNLCQVDSDSINP